MLNQLFPDGSVLQFPAPAAVTKGMPCLIGQMPAVAIDNYSTVTGRVTFCLEGVYALTVIGQSTVSPVSGLACKVGDELFASGGTLDATTNITTGITIDKTRGGVPFGNYVGQASIASGATDTAAPVRIQQQVSRD